MANPYQSLRNRIAGLGNDVVLDHVNVEIAVPLHLLARTGTAPDPVVTRAGANSMTLVSTGDGDEDTYFNYEVPIVNYIVAERGWKLNSVTVDYTVATAAIEDITVACASVAHAAAGNTATALTGTYDTAHDTTAERLAVGNHRLVYTITSPTTFSTAKAFPSIEILLATKNTAVTTIRGVILNMTLLTP